MNNLNSKIIELIKSRPISYQELIPLLIQKLDINELATLAVNYIKNSHQWRVADSWGCINDLSKYEWQELNPNIEWLVTIENEHLFIGHKGAPFIPGFQYTPLFSLWPDKSVYKDALLIFTASEMTRKEAIDHLDMGGTVRYKRNNGDKWSEPMSFIPDSNNGIYGICDRSGNFCRNLYRVSNGNF